MLITPEQLQRVTDNLNDARCKVMADLLNELCPKYGITDKGVFNIFLANLLQESGEFAHKEENMNYSAERLVAVWPGRFKSPEDAAPYAHNPEKLANSVYSGRMGNNLPGDGFLFKGGSFIGLTGRSVYTDYATYIGKTVEEAASLIRSTDQYALDSACWFFAIYKRLIPVALTGDFKGVCALINTGSIKGNPIGYSTRLKYYERAKTVLG